MDNKIDDLIKKAISQEIDNIDIDDKNIEEEWKKFKSIKKKRDRVKKLKRTLPIAIVIILGTIIAMPFLTSESYSWNIFKLFNIINNDGKTSIQQKSSTNTLTEHSVNSINERITTLDKARDIIDFIIITLPFDLIETKLVGDREIHLTYNSPDGEILFIQKQIGLENTQTINVSQSSKVEKFNIDNTEYTYINIKGKIIKVIWEITGVKYEINVKYPISINQAKNLINKLDY
jgi:hypothetical protein